MKFIKTNSLENNEPIQLAYDDYGTGQPIVLIHGWPLCKEMWEYQIDTLVNAGFRVIAYDRRGFGCSSKPWDSYDYETLGDDLNALITTLDLNNATLVGFSMGGGEIAKYCSKYGVNRLKNVIIVSSVLPGLKKSDENPEGFTDDQYNEMLKGIETDRLDFLQNFGKDFFGVGFLNHPVSDSLLQYYTMLGSMASPRATKECMKAFVYTDFKIDIAAITVPALIIHGDEDKTVPIDISSRRLAKMLTNAQYIEYSGAPHGLFYTEKDRLSRDIVSFASTDKISDNYETEMVYDVLPSNDPLVI